jgi:autoinducer 2-degrading protein
MPEGSKGKLAVTVDLLVDGNRDRFMSLMAENAAASLRNEPGCRQFDVCIDVTNENRLFLYEVYDDDAAFTAHLASPHYKAFEAQTASMILRKDVQRFWLTTA